MIRPNAYGDEYLHLGADNLVAVPLLPHWYFRSVFFNENFKFSISIFYQLLQKKSRMLFDKINYNKKKFRE